MNLINSKMELYSDICTEKNKGQSRLKIASSSEVVGIKLQENRIELISCFQKGETGE